MSSDLHFLRSAFIVNHHKVHAPDLVVRCRGYQWQVHRKLVDHHRSNAVPGRLRISNQQIDVHNEDPLLLARLVQWLYTNTYDESLFECNDINPGNGISLMELVRSQNAKTAKADEDRDSKRPLMQLHLLMCRLADLFDFIDMREQALERAIQSCSASPDKFLVDASGHLTQHSILKDARLRSRFVQYFCENKTALAKNTVQEWLRGDGVFAVDVMEYMSQRHVALEAQVGALQEGVKRKRSES